MEVVDKEQLLRCTFTNSSLDKFRQGRFCQIKCWDFLKSYKYFIASKKIARMWNTLIGKHPQLMGYDGRRSVLQGGSHGIES